jgi:hypothetical protein
VSVRHAQRYMKVAADNFDLLAEAYAHGSIATEATRVSQTKPDLELLKRFKFDTIRKYAISFVPEKTHPEHKGNKKFQRLASFMNIVNEFSRLKQRHIEGLQKIDFDEARDETHELYRFLQWLPRRCSSRRAVPNVSPLTFH